MRQRKSKQTQTDTRKLQYIYFNNGDMSWTPYVYQPSSSLYTTWQLIEQNTVGASTCRTTDFKKPTTISGTIDHRYKSPQFTNNDGSRDMRTTLTSQRN